MRSNKTPKLQVNKSLVSKEKKTPVKQVFHPGPNRSLPVGAELKVSDAGSGPSLVSSSAAGAIYDLVALAQGLAATNRIGDSVTFKHMRLCLFGSGVGTVPLRIIVFQFNQDTAAGSPAVSDVLQTFGTVMQYVNPIALDSAERGEIGVVLDQTIDFATSGTSGSLVTRTWDVALNTNASYNTGATTGYGKYYACVVSATTAAAANYAFTSRIAFTDS